METFIRPCEGCIARGDSESDSPLVGNIFSCPLVQALGALTEQTLIKLDGYTIGVPIPLEDLRDNLNSGNMEVDFHHSDGVDLHVITCTPGNSSSN